MCNPQNEMAYIKAKADLAKNNRILGAIEVALSFMLFKAALSSFRMAKVLSK